MRQDGLSLARAGMAQDTVVATQSPAGVNTRKGRLFAKYYRHQCTTPTCRLRAVEDSGKPHRGREPAKWHGGALDAWKRCYVGSALCQTRIAGQRTSEFLVHIE